jgi:uncharacterized membrane protein
LPDNLNVSNNFVSIWLDDRLLTGLYINNSYWSYRKPILINNTLNPNNLTDYQVLVTLDTQNLISQGKMRSDCGDIRFTDSDGSSLLNYWIESGCNTNNTKIWVRVPFIQANSAKTIYVYYGNPSATSLSNGTATFDFFDDFSTDTLANYDHLTDLRWHPIPYGDAGNCTFSYDSVNQRVYFSCPDDYMSAISPKKTLLPNMTNLRVRFRILISKFGDDHSGISAHVRYKDINNSYYISLSNDASESKLGKIVGRTHTVLARANFSARTDVPYTLEFQVFGSTLRYLRDGALVASATDTSLTSPGRVLIYPSEINGWIDDIIIAKYSSPEPTTSVGDEEIAAATDSFGNYNYTFFAPLEAGTHTIKVNLTNENSTNIYVAHLTSKIFEYPQLVHKGDILQIKSYSLANQSNSVNLTQVWLNYTLPLGWNIINQSNFLGNLTPGEMKWNNITINITGSAQLGIQNITISSRSFEGIKASDNITILVFGWSNSTAYLSRQVVNPGDSVAVSCLVRDNVSLESLNNYPVEIYINSTLITSGLTSNGWFNYTFNSPFEPGNYLITCAIYDNPTLFYNASLNGSSILQVVKSSLSIFAPSKVHRGFIYNISGKLYYQGGSNITNVWLNFTLPQGFEVIQGNKSKLFDLVSQGEYWNNITIQVTPSSALGLNSINLSTNSSEAIWDRTSFALEVWGWSDVNLSLSKTRLYNYTDKNLTIDCFVKGNNTNDGIPNYPVEILVDGVSLANLITNSSGSITYVLDLSPYSLGTHLAKCVIRDNSTLWYNSSINESTKTFEIWEETNLTKDYRVNQNFTTNSTCNVVTIWVGNYTRKDTQELIPGEINITIDSIIKSCQGSYYCEKIFYVGSDPSCELKPGNKTIYVSAFNSSAFYELSNFSFNYYLEDLTTRATIIAHNLTVYNVSLFEDKIEQFNITINNTGKATMRNVQISKYSGPFAIVNTTPIPDIPPEQAINVTFNLTVPAGNPLGTYNQIYNASWLNNNLKPSGIIYSPIQRVIVVGNPMLQLNTTNITRIINHGETYSEVILINSTGNTALKNVWANYTEINLPKEWITINPNYWQSIEHGTSADFTVTISIPKGTSPGLYRGIINVTSRLGYPDERKESIEINITVPVDSRWIFKVFSRNGTEVTQIEETYGLVEAGLLGNLTIENLGNVPLNFTFSYSAISASNPIDLGIFELNKVIGNEIYNPTYLFVEKQSNSTAKFYQNGYYVSLDLVLNLTIFNSSAIPISNFTIITWHIIDQPPYIQNLTYSKEVEIKKLQRITAYYDDDQDLLAIVYLSVTLPNSTSERLVCAQGESIGRWLQRL